MHIFIDESGTFAGFGAESISLVGALCIPSSMLPRVCKKYAQLREHLPKHNGEVKGKLLSEAQVARVVDLLRGNGAIVEFTAIDTGCHTLELVVSYRDALAAEMQNRRVRFNDQARLEVDRAINQIRKTPPQLFLQALATIGVLESVVQNIPLYFAQRQSSELGEFHWIVDAKDRDKATDWESWWSTYCQGVLSSRSRLRPGVELEGADYSYFSKFNAEVDEGQLGTDLKLLMANFRFSSQPEVGLESVDILTNAVRRGMVGNLGEEGWGGIRSLMIHRPDQYISLVMLPGAIPEREPRYATVVRRFKDGGRNMLSPRFLAEARS